MPPIATFHRGARYYGTLAHETIHWTGATKRLDRLGRFNDRKAYAFEELVAEIGNCMLCAQIGVEPEFDQSAAYVEGWLEAIKEDSRAIFRAASEAQKTVDYIMERTARADRTPCANGKRCPMVKGTAVFPSTLPDVSRHWRRHRLLQATVVAVFSRSAVMNCGHEGLSASWRQMAAVLKSFPRSTSISRAERCCRTRPFANVLFTCLRSRSISKSKRVRLGRALAEKSLAQNIGQPSAHSARLYHRERTESLLRPAQVPSKEAGRDGVAHLVRGDRPHSPTGHA